MTLNEHRKLAKLVLRFQNYLDEQTPTKKKVTAIRLWQAIKCDLDRDYHNLISNTQFEKYGHIYYGGHKECPILLDTPKKVATK